MDLDTTKKITRSQEGPTVSPFSKNQSDFWLVLCLSSFLIIIPTPSHAVNHLGFLIRLPAHTVTLNSAFCKYAYPPVIDIEQPVETHVHTKWNVDQNGPLLFQSLVQSCQTVNHLHHIHHMLPLLQILLPKHLHKAAQCY